VLDTPFDREHVLVEEAQGTDMEVDGAPRHLSVLRQEELVLLHILGAELVRRPHKVPDEAPHLLAIHQVFELAHGDPPRRRTPTNGRHDNGHTRRIADPASVGKGREAIEWMSARRKGFHRAAV